MQNVYEELNIKECQKRRIRVKKEMNGREEWEIALSIYRKKINPSVELFYIGDYKIILLFEVRTVSLEVNGGIYRWSGKSKMCDWYTQDVKETVEHITKCAGYENERHSLVECMMGITGEKRNALTHLW